MENKICPLQPSTMLKHNRYFFFFTQANTDCSTIKKQSNADSVMLTHQLERAPCVVIRLDIVPLISMPNNHKYRYRHVEPYSGICIALHKNVALLTLSFCHYQSIIPVGIFAQSHNCNGTFLYKKLSKIAFSCLATEYGFSR